ncbi:MAG: mur ligase middle domain protein [Burkholderiales bacterium]|jgi:UDP-N-acetylmuramyl tripeptide synthase|nr:mur ligase middle domain protein [Burkholderiales bacterium]
MENLVNNSFKLPEGRSTRLFGDNLFFDNSGAVLDVPVTDNQDELVKFWLLELHRVLPVIGWEDNYQTGYKKYSKGIRFAISAPYDLLWAATELVEYLWISVRHKFEFDEFLSLDNAKSYMLPVIDKYTNITYRRVHAEAKRRSLNIFEDGAQVAIGSGKYSYLVALDQLVFDNIPWDTIKEIPAVLVTGTNGKTTTVRLTRFICKTANKIVGYCSSDWIMVGDEVIERGDLSGPSGNLGVMMNQKVEIAVLEVARGGLLRRGISTNFVSSATVTNISEDHLTEDGVDTLEELAQAKALVYKAIAPDGYAIINLDDELMRKYSKKLATKKIFITKDITKPEHQSYLVDAEYICYAANEAFYWREKNNDYLVSEFANTPITVNGKALHNIENALHAIALSFTLGNSIEHIGRALRQYENNAENNLGRANVFNYNGGKIIVDFAHNAAGFEAMVNLVKSYVFNEGRLGILLGNTGNRMSLTDKITDAVIKGRPDFVIIKELTTYLRGTEPGEVVRQMQNMLINKGLNKKNIQLADNEFEALEIVLDYIKPGDAFLFIAHESTEEIIEKLKSVVEK